MDTYVSIALYLVLIPRQVSTALYLPSAVPASG